MRFLFFLILLVILFVVGAFAFINSEPVPLNYFDRSLGHQTVSLPMALVIGAVYILGMVSGWTVVGFLKRSVERVTDRQQ